MLPAILLGCVFLILGSLAKDDEKHYPVNDANKLKEPLASKADIKIASDKITFTLKAQNGANDEINQYVAFAFKKPFEFKATPACTDKDVEIGFHKDKTLKWTKHGNQFKVEYLVAAGPSAAEIKATASGDLATTVRFWKDKDLELDVGGKKETVNGKNKFDLQGAKNENGNIVAYHPRFSGTPQCDVKIEIPNAKLWVEESQFKTPPSSTTPSTPKTTKASTTTTTASTPDNASTDETPATTPDGTEDTTPTSGTGGLGLPGVLLLGVGALLLRN